MEVELFKQIVKNTEHKTSFQIIVSDNESRVLKLDLTQSFSWLGIKYMK